ncbi:hypothetical protein TNCV_2099281 [Trichonephila clavipes]|nr:hypothetical protein TNCV_2099281 [Trichonephila clavipes]
MQLIAQECPTHALVDSSPVRMLASPYGRYPQIEGTHLRCLHWAIRVVTSTHIAIILESLPSLRMTLWVIPSSSDSSSWVQPHSRWLVTTA